MRKIVLRILLPTLLLHPLAGQERASLAVFDLKPAGVSPGIATAASALVRAGLGRLERFSLIDRAHVEAALKKEGYAPGGCADQECALRAGWLVNAEKLAVGEIVTLGNTLVITARILDGRSGGTMYAARETAGSTTEIAAAVSRLVAALRLQIDGQSEAYPGITERELAALMYRCGNAPRRGDIVLLERDRGMAALPGARARVKGFLKQNEKVFIDLIWLDEKARGQSDGGYEAAGFRLVERFNRPR